MCRTLLPSCLRLAGHPSKKILYLHHVQIGVAGIFLAFNAVAIFCNIQLRVKFAYEQQEIVCKSPSENPASKFFLGGASAERRGEDSSPQKDGHLRGLASRWSFSGVTRENRKVLGSVLGGPDFLRISFSGAGFFRGFCRWIFFSFLWGKKCPEKSSMKIPGKILRSLYNKNPRHISAYGGRSKKFAKEGHESLQGAPSSSCFQRESDSLHLNGARMRCC